MDIARLSTSLSAQQLQQNVGTAVLGKALDASKMQGQQLQNLMQSAAVVTDPMMGNKVNIMA